MTENEYQALPVETRMLLFATKLLSFDGGFGYGDKEPFAFLPSVLRDCLENEGSQDDGRRRFDECTEIRLTRDALRALVSEADAGGWWPTAETLRNQFSQTGAVSAGSACRHYRNLEQTMGGRRGAAE